MYVPGVTELIGPRYVIDELGKGVMGQDRESAAEAALEPIDELIQETFLNCGNGRRACASPAPISSGRTWFRVRSFDVK